MIALHFHSFGRGIKLFEDGEKFYLKVKQAGVDITFRAGKGMVHCYPLLAPMFKAASEARNEIVDFIQRHLKIRTDTKNH